MIDWNNFDAAEAARQAVEDGDANAADLFGRIADLEYELVAEVREIGRLALNNPNWRNP